MGQRPATRTRASAQQAMGLRNSTDYIAYTYDVGYESSTYQNVSDPPVRMV